MGFGISIKHIISHHNPLSKTQKVVSQIQAGREKITKPGGLDLPGHPSLHDLNRVAAKLGGKKPKGFLHMLIQRLKGSFQRPGANGIKIGRLIGRDGKPMQLDELIAALRKQGRPDAGQLKDATSFIAGSASRDRSDSSGRTGRSGAF